MNCGCKTTGHDPGCPQRVGWSNQFPTATEPTVAEDAAWDSHCERHAKKERELKAENAKLLLQNGLLRNELVNLRAVAGRVFQKYGVGSDWTEWTDLAERIEETDKVLGTDLKRVVSGPKCGRCGEVTVVQPDQRVPPGWSWCKSCDKLSKLDA